VQLGLINTLGTSNKALVVQQNDKSKNPKKQQPRHKNKQNKGPKPFPPTFAPNGDKGEKSKNKKTDKHCNFCGKDGHVDNGHFNHVLCVPSLSYNCLSVYQITHSSEGKTVEFSPHKL
jgi:hypothetical protein